MNKHYNIIARTNGVGLDQDVDIVHNTLTNAGHQVTISHCRSIKPWSKFLPAKPIFDANIFLERIFTRWIGTATKNYLIPNQERFPTRQIPHLKHIHKTLCKSKHAREIFSTHATAEYTGFTSNDRSLPNTEPDYQTYLHLAGRSTLKGTDTLIEVWKKHPDWPTLTIIQHQDNAPTQVPSNINLITTYLPEPELKKHLNTHGIHLCPSLSEGWGHYIVEAMSCAAVVLTTDAPPMNELVTPQRGILVPHHKTEPRHLGTNFHIDPTHLETSLTALIQAPHETKQKLATNARQWFQQNNESFPDRLLTALAD